MDQRQESTSQHGKKTVDTQRRRVGTNNQSECASKWEMGLQTDWNGVIYGGTCSFNYVTVFLIDIRG